MDLAGFRNWLDRYVTASSEFNRGAIEDLFAEGVRYLGGPWDEPIHGLDALVAFWEKELRSRRLVDAVTTPLALAAEVGVAEWWARYAPEPDRPGGREYSSVLVLRFDDAGRGTEYREWCLPRPDGR